MNIQHSTSNSQHSTPIHAWRLNGLLRLAFACCLAAQAWAGSPRIACPASDYDFGTQENTRPVDHVFTIRNEGLAPLQIGQIRACCGATASISDTVIQPGTSAALRVTYVLAGRKGPQRKALYVASNDPREPYLQLRLLGTAVEALDVSPRHIDFGVLEQGAATNREIAIRSESNLVLNVTNVVASAGFTTAARKTGEVWKIKVGTATSLPLGVTRGNVTAFTDNKAYPRVEIPLAVTIAGDIVVTPGEIALAELASGKTAAVTRCVAFRSRSGRAFQILAMTPPNPAMTVEKTALVSGGYRITLGNILPGEGLNGREFVVTTDNPLLPRIAVPFVFRHPVDIAATNEVVAK